MFYYSKNSKEKIVHDSHCCCFKIMNKQNVRCFATLEEARAAGYRLCDRCAPINRFIRGNRKAINEFCRRNGMLCYLHDGSITIKAPFSMWKIILHEKTRKHIFLYHKNIYNSLGNSAVPGYHSQSVRRNAVLAYLEYIAAHEEYRQKNPLVPTRQSASPPRKGTKRWNKEQRRLENMRRRDAIHRTLYLIDQVSSEKKRAYI